MSKKPKARIDPVEVFCRIRPIGEEDGDSCLKILDEQNLMLEIPECSASYRSGQIKKVVYSFAKIFGDTTTQKEIFEKIGLPLVKDLLDGKNGLLFTYGVTGSGKTYSMTGNQQELGLLQRCLDTVFNSISFNQAKKCIFKPDKMNSFEIQSESEALLERHQRKDILFSASQTPIHNQFSSRVNNNNGVVTSAIQQLNTASQQQQMSTPFKIKAQLDARRLNEPSGKLVNIFDEHIYAVFVSCIEIYNNYIYDLLDEFNTTSTDSAKRMDNSKESKMLKEDTKGTMYIKDIAEIEVKSTEEALELMHRAQKRRVVACTDLNAESSRSHSIFTIRVVQTSYDSLSDDQQKSNKTNVHVSQLSLVDLAGSERTKRTKNTGSRLREAGSINSSLMALRNCMETLRENIMNGTRKMVPYRDSKLTLLFKNYFEGNGKIKMILCINPSAIEFDETINVLKFSDLVRDILVPVVTNDIQRNINGASKYSIDKISIDSLEQASLNLLNSLQQNNYPIMIESFPAMDVFTPDDSQTLNKLTGYLEEYQRRRTSFIHELEPLKQQFYLRMREISEELDKVKEERDELKNRLESKEREQLKMDSKIKALEKVININNFRTPMQSSGMSSNKENRPQFMTPSKGGSANSNSGGGSGCGAISNTAGFVNGMSSNSNNFVQSGHQAINSEKPPSSSSVGKTPITSTIRSTETPVASTYRSSRITHTTATQSINRAYAVNTNLPPQTPLKEGLPVANKRNQRRSKSAEMWLDHKPSNLAKIDTVMQPKMQRKKSVSKLELNDAKKSSKYVLTHQQQDEDGEVITNLIKGDILKSPSGGANVVFTDIETLQCRAHDQPKQSRKRISEEFKETIEDQLIIQERCSIAIEGHSYNRSKPIKKTKF